MQELAERQQDIAEALEQQAGEQPEGQQPQDNPLAEAQQAAENAANELAQNNLAEYYLIPLFNCPCVPFSQYPAISSSHTHFGHLHATVAIDTQLQNMHEIRRRMPCASPYVFMNICSRRSCFT